MHPLARIRAAGYSIMLASAGALSAPLTAYAPQERDGARL